MPTQEERLTIVEQALKRFSEDMKDLKHHVTMLIGLTSKEELDYRDTKISLRAIEENVQLWDRRLDKIEEHLGSLQSGFETHNKKLDAQDKKLDQILLLLNTSTASQNK